MKKSLSQAIAAATLLGAAAAANAAININPGGEGQALLYPYYTVENPANNGSANYTALHITNTTDEFKAVKVRFRRFTDSADVLNFNLYLSPQDMWTGAVVADDNGQPKLISADSSCISHFPNGLATDAPNGQPFLGKVIGADQYDTSDMTKGHIEVIEMASWSSSKYDTFGNRIFEGTADRAKVIDGVSVAEAIEHIVDANGDRVPGNCAAINESWKINGHWGKLYGMYAASASYPNGDLAGSPFTYMDLGGQPTGGIYGNAYVINPDEAWSSSFAPVAIDELYVPAGNPGDDAVVVNNNHHAPKYELPSLHGGDNVPLWEVGGQRLSGLIVNENHMMADRHDIRSLFYKDSVRADYTLNGPSQVSTELVLTYPMKYTDNKYHQSAAWMRATFYDREEDRVVAEVDSWQLSPWMPENPELLNKLNNEVNVIRLENNGGRSDIGDATHILESPFETGWVELAFFGVPVAKEGFEKPVPVIGFASSVLKNPTLSANGADNSYALNFPLKYTKHVHVGE